MNDYDTIAIEIVFSLCGNFSNFHVSINALTAVGALMTIKNYDYGLLR